MMSDFDLITKMAIFNVRIEWRHADNLLIVWSGNRHAAFHVKDEDKNGNMISNYIKPAMIALEKELK